MRNEIDIVEKAKAHKNKKPKCFVSDDDGLRLALAWLADGITATQAAAAIGRDGQSAGTVIIYAMANALKKGIKEGKVKLTYKP